MRELAPELWVTERPLRFGGLQVGTRMTVIRLSSGGLFLHSPVRLEPALAAALDTFGRPRFVVAPNRFHHLFAGDYVAAYPACELFVAPGLERKRPDLKIAGVLDDTAHPGWAGEIDQVLIRGVPLMNEVVFLHRATRTLLTSDLVFNIGRESPALTRWGFRLLGGYGRFGTTVIERLLVRDRAAARASLERVLAWDFDRVVLAHGQVLEHGGVEGLRRAYAWLLKKTNAS
jgi:hypothetical protein